MLKECFSHWTITKNNQTYDRYSYESARAMYDVDICQADDKRTYHISEGESYLPTQVHRSIEKYFDVIIPGARPYVRSRYQFKRRETNIHNQRRKKRAPTPWLQFYAYKPTPDSQEPPETNPDGSPNTDRAAFRLKTYRAAKRRAQRLFGPDTVVFEYADFMDRDTWRQVV